MALALLKAEALQAAGHKLKSRRNPSLVVLRTMKCKYFEADVV